MKSMEMRSKEEKGMELAVDYPRGTATFARQTMDNAIEIIADYDKSEVM